LAAALHFFDSESRDFSKEGEKKEGEKISKVVVSGPNVDAIYSTFKVGRSAGGFG